MTFIENGNNGSRRVDGGSSRRPGGSILPRNQTRAMDLAPGRNILDQSLGLDDAMLGGRVIDIVTGVVRDIALTAQRIQYHHATCLQADGKRRALQYGHVDARAGSYPDDSRASSRRPERFA
ncbi:MAG TPA: hypothetical protein VNQ81_15125 [Povalibacter sp.]|nr:hypothetical protein [Povalibacter sp.]